MSAATLAALKAKSAGWLAASKGASIEACPYRSLAMSEKWIEGYREFLKRMEKVKGQ